MNTARYAFAMIGRMLPCAAILCVSAFGAESAISILQGAPLSLPRLAPEAQKLGHKLVNREAFEVLAFSPGQRAKQKERGGSAYLEIEPGAEWAQGLRNQRAGANYVSFTLNASIGSQIDIAGASLVIEQSQRDTSYAAIRATGTDKSIDHEMPWMLFGGARMAALDIVTVKLDRKAGTWAMWFRDTLVAEDMPLAAQQNGPSQIHVTAGKGGAWVCALVCSDENPLFEDANDNAVPDEFEQEILGKLLEKNADGVTRANLRLVWQDRRRTRPPSEFVLTTPLPDSFPEDCAPEGQIVHGMTGGLKFGASKN
jgi:hypothetical protein